MSGLPRDIFATKELEGTTKTPAKPATAMQTNFMSHLQLKSMNKQQQTSPSVIVPPSKMPMYDDGDKPITTASKPAVAAATKTAQKRKAEDSDDETKKKSTDFDNAELTEDEYEDDEDEEDDASDDEDEEDEDETDEEDEIDQGDLATVDEIMQITREHLHRGSRPKNFVGTDGSSSAGEDDDDDEDEMKDEEKKPKKTKATQKKSVANETWAEHLLGAKAMSNVLKNLQQLDAKVTALRPNDIWVLNKLLANVLAPRFPNLVATAIGITSSIDPDVAARCEKLESYNPRQSNIAAIKKMPNQYCQMISLADEFGLIRSLVSTGVDRNTILLNMRLDPFKDADLKSFAAMAASMGFWPEKHQWYPITQDRYALIKGETSLSQKNSEAAMKEDIPESEAKQPTASQLKETFASPPPPPPPHMQPENVVQKQPFVEKITLNHKHVMVASSRNLLACNHETNIKLGKIGWTISPNRILSSLFEYQADIRANAISPPVAETRRDAKRFVHYLYLSTQLRNPAVGPILDDYMADRDKKMIDGDEDFAFAHLLFGFLVPKKEYAIRDSSTEPFSFDRCLVESFDRATNQIVREPLTLGVNELPSMYSFAMQAKTRVLLDMLWKDYCQVIQLAPNETAENYRSLRDMRSAQKEIVKKSAAYINSRAWTTSEESQLSGPQAVQDMLLSAIEAIFVI